MAEEFATTGQPERARDHYAKLARKLTSAPADLQFHRGLALVGEAEAILSLGVFTDVLDRFREAYPLLNEPHRQLPRWVLRQFAEERMQLEDGSFEALRNYLRGVTTLGHEVGDESTAPRVIGWLQQRCLVGSIAQREATARAAVEALPGVDWPVLALVAVLRRDGRVAEAEQLLAPLVPRGSGDLWFRWGIQLSTLLRYDEAIAAYDEAARRGPGPESPWSRGPILRAECLLFRGLAHHQTGRTRQADADLRQAAAVAPHDPRIHYSLGRLAVHLGADHEAWSHFTYAMAVESGFVPAQLGLGLLRELHGRPAEAGAHYQAAMRMDPTSWPARVRLGAVLLAAGRREDAEALLKPAIGGSYWGAMAAFHYGLARFRSNDTGGAVDTWEPLRAGDLQEWLAFAHDRGARLRLPFDPTAARLEWQLALLDTPELPERRTALREAALREAAEIVLTGRDAGDARVRAGAALDLEIADEGPLGAAMAGRRDRIRALIDLAGGSTATVAGLLGASPLARDRYHLAAAALAEGRPDEVSTLLAPADADPDDFTALRPDPDDERDPAAARLRALAAEHERNWAEALLWHRRFLTAGGPAEDGPVDDGDGAGGSLVPLRRGLSPAADVAEDDTDIIDVVVVDEDPSTSTLILDALAIAQAKPGLYASTTPRAIGSGRENERVLCTTAVGTACAEVATHACAGCGREGCKTHLYRAAGLVTYRCERCAGPALQAILYCARQADALELAEPTLAGWAAAMDGSTVSRPLRRQVALLRAEAGDLDDALRWLPAEYVDERVRLLIRRAAAGIRLADPYAAIRDLREVLTLRPGQAEATAGLAALAEYEARRHATEGRHREAFDGYLALVRMDPTNPRLLHALGLAAHELARMRGNPDHWRWTIGCLVSALYADGFWAEVDAADGEHATGAERIAEARRAVVDELRAELRAADEAADRGLEAHDSWTVRIAVDVFACEVAAEAGFGSEGEEAPRRVMASPVLDRLLRDQPATPALAAWREETDAALARRGVDEDLDFDNEVDRDKLAALYGPFGVQRYLYEDARYEAAVIALDAVPEPDRDADWTSLLRQALIMRGMELHLDEHWREALVRIARAVSLAPDREPDSVLVEIAVESGLNTTRDLLEADENDWAGVVEVLETAYTVAPDEVVIRAELGRAHTRGAAEHSAESADYLQALKHVRRALELIPHDPAANRLLEVVLAQRAGQLTRRGPDADLHEAVQWWQELIEINPIPLTYHGGLSRALRLLACSAALAGDRHLANERMKWGLQADPEWTGDAEEESFRQIAAHLIADAMDEVPGRGFEERAHCLRTALAYRDTPELRNLMVALWRGEAVRQFDQRHYGLSTALLEEALYLGGNPDGAARPRDLAAGYRADGEPAYHWLRYPQARSLMKRTVDHFPDEDELRELQSRIDDLR